MPNVIISTVGTSLLTKQIRFGDPTEATWNRQLRDAANCTRADTPAAVRTIIDELKQRAERMLAEATVETIRNCSAELNGIYGHYQNDLSQGKADRHFLIATDTAQGQVTAEVVAKFLRSQKLQVECYTPPGLSAANTESFAEGIDDLIVWLQKKIKPLRDSYKVYFNLVGSFKSLQGYMNTIGMFYADAILYIFEGQGSQLITIPRLPIQIDTELLAPHVIALARMDAGAGLSSKEVAGIPEAMLGECDGKKVLSTWGKLTWDEAKLPLLSQQLLPFPKLLYADDFRSDYNNIKDPKQRAELQQKLAQVSQVLVTSAGDTRSLARFNYSPYKGVKGIDHFYVNYSLRVSCRKTNDALELRHYGTHDQVERSEGVR